jgi:hypothetical protein
MPQDQGDHRRQRRVLSPMGSGTMPSSAATTWNESDTPALVEVRRHRMRGGVAASLALHAVIALLIAFDLMHFVTPMPTPADLAIPVDLVRLAPLTAGPSVKRRADLPQEPAPGQATDTDQPRPSPPAPPRQATLPPVPAPQPPGAPPAARQALAEAMTRPPAKAPAEKIATRAKAAVPLPANRKPAPADPLTLQLETLARQKLASVPMSPGKGDPADTGLSNTTTTSANAAAGPQATYSARDFLRVQVIRHWNLRVEPSQSAGWTVSIHLQLRRDGSVTMAEIVDPGRYRLNRPYLDFALSARNAVLMSSPLVIPPGQYDLVSDIVLPFSARDVLQ